MLAECMLRIAGPLFAAAAEAAAAASDSSGNSAPAEGTAPGNGYLAGRERFTETDADGNFAFAYLPPGSYDPLSADSLVVLVDKGALRRLRMPDKVSQRDRVRITFKAGKASDAGLLFAQKNAPSVSDGTSTEPMSKRPDGDAAVAVKRVSRISIAGDGQVYVHGLGERYVNVQLKGLTLSSPNFEKRVIPLDIFPTRLIENLVISKSFTAGQPAEFAGGALQLRTKDYPDKRILEVSASGTFDPGTTVGDKYTYEGGDLDFLGMDDGARALLASLPNFWTPHGTLVCVADGPCLRPLGDAATDAFSIQIGEKEKTKKYSGHLVMAALGGDNTGCVDSKNVLASNITKDCELDGSSTYSLQGLTFVKDGVTLTIGASTKDNPIVFTAGSASPERGDFGGLVILGDDDMFDWGMGWCGTLRFAVGAHTGVTNTDADGIEADNLTLIGNGTSSLNGMRRRGGPRAGRSTKPGLGRPSSRGPGGTGFIGVRSWAEKRRCGPGSPALRFRRTSQGRPLPASWMPQHPARQ